MFDVATERGVANVSVADVVERSGVSRRTFYESFSDREDCLLAAFEDALELASMRVLSAYRSERKWCERIRAGLFALLSFLGEEPVIGRLLIVESSSGGSRTLERRTGVLSLLAVAVDEGRSESANSDSLPPLTAEGLVGGALALIQARTARPEHGQRTRTGKARGEGSSSIVGGGLVGLTNQLMSMIVLPYLGSAAARRELERPVESCSSVCAGTSDGSTARLLEDPFKSAGMRLTYRTVRVLMAIAEHPGASNRLIGQSAGVSDQGQISKLLGRLERMSLVTKGGLASGQGLPNAWILTEKGSQLADAIRLHTDDA